MRFCIGPILSLFSFASAAFGQGLVFPPRATNAPGGSEFVKQIESLPFVAREEAILAQITAGNVPEFLRGFCPVTITNVVAGLTNRATIFVAPDYLAVGKNEDYFFTPLSPYTAQRLADRFDCTLPTRKMADEIWRAATVKLEPAPIPPGREMVTVPVFVTHNTMVSTQRAAQANAHPLGVLVAGDKKDVVITSRLVELTNRVAIYGWHKLDGKPIQPLYLGHTAAWVDYSHGIRLVRQQMTVNGEPRKVAEVLADPQLAGLLSDEGVMTSVRYPTESQPVIPIQLAAIVGEAKTNHAPAWSDFKPTGSFGERSVTFNFEPDVRILVNVPAHADFAAEKPVRLIFYALPNGNTIEQTIGKKLATGDDWHFNIQHIGAQTRWLRQRLTNQVVVVAYLEAAMKSWPAWRQKHGDKFIPSLFETVKGIFQTNQIEIVLTGHSGGGSLTFGYLNAVENIPSEISRIAFLDSNYAYQTTNHFDKLLRWLQTSEKHTLCVLAYQDYLGLLDGKPFVSERGGTWGRSQEMLKDLSEQFSFNDTPLRDGLKCRRALDGRITFLLKENPERRIFHTIQVERNGFIHSQLSGTKFEGRGYEYFGERTYEQLIE